MRAFPRTPSKNFAGCLLLVRRDIVIALRAASGCVPGQGRVPKNDERARQTMTRSGPSQGLSGLSGCEGSPDICLRDMISCHPALHGALVPSASAEVAMQIVKKMVVVLTIEPE
jgi:hypothetical protein